MKKITLLIFLFIYATISYSQKVAIIGMNHLSVDPAVDGFSFVALENLTSGEKIYFTENEYNNTSNQFVDLGESVVLFTANTNIPKGTAIYISETGQTTNTFNISGFGSAIKTAGSSNFSFSTTGEEFYAYSDNDENPANGITTIHSLMYTGTDIPSSSGGNIPSGQDPSVDFPSAIVIDGFPSVAPNRTEFKISAGDRTNVTRSILESTSSYVHAQANVALSTQVFTNLNISAPLPVNLIFFEGRNEKEKNILEWATATEQNNQGFEVERSTNNLKFNKVGEINSNGTYFEQQNYSFSDVNPGGNSYYYRLKQIDIDGEFVYSKIIFLKSNEYSQLKAYPNPIINELIIETGNQNKIQLFDLSGRQLPVTFTKIGFINQCNLEQFPSGIYLLKVMSEKGIESRLLTKL